MDKGDDWIILQIDKILTNDKKTSLLLREQWFIDNFNCINKNCAIQTKEKLKQYKTEWAAKKRDSMTQEEKEKHRAYQKEWDAIKRYSMTQEERDAYNSKRREARSLKKV